MKDLEDILKQSIEGLGESRGQILKALQSFPKEQKDSLTAIMQNLDKSLEKKDVNLLNNQMVILKSMLKK